MSRSKRKKQNPKILGVLPQSMMPIVLVVIGVLILTTAILIITSGGTASNAAPEVTGAPAIEVDQALFDLGDMRVEQQAEVTYRLSNKGDQSLRILEVPRVEVRAGC